MIRCPMPTRPPAGAFYSRLATAAGHRHKTAPKTANMRPCRAHGDEKGAKWPYSLHLWLRRASRHQVYVVLVCAPRVLSACPTDALLRLSCLVWHGVTSIGRQLPPRQPWLCRCEDGSVNGSQEVNRPAELALACHKGTRFTTMMFSLDMDTRSAGAHYERSPGQQ